MNVMTAHANFDGKKIVLDEPLELQPDTKLIVTVLPDQLADSDTEHDDWLNLARISIGRVYGENESEYTMDMIKERNPE